MRACQPCSCLTESTSLASVRSGLIHSLIPRTTPPPSIKTNDPQTHITPASFRDRALQKLVQEINFLKAQAVEPLSTFLEYLT